MFSVSVKKMDEDGSSEGERRGTVVEYQRIFLIKDLLLLFIPFRKITHIESLQVQCLNYTYYLPVQYL